MPTNAETFSNVRLSPLGSILPLRCAWCPHRAVFLLSRTSADNNEYRDNVCPEHAQEWAPYVQREQLSFDMEIW